MGRRLKDIAFLFLFTALLFISSFSSAQESSSRLSYKKSPVKNRVGILLDSAEYNLDSDLPNAFDYIEEALETSISTGNKYGEARSYQLLAKTNFNLERYHLAVDYYRKALLHISLLSSDELMHIYHEMALALEQEKNIDDALVQMYTAIRYALKSGNIYQEIAIRYDMARILVSNKETNKALQEYETIQRLEEKRNNQGGIAIASNFKGEVYLLQNKPQQAISNYQKAERIADETEDISLKKVSLRNQGKAYRQSRQYEEELKVRQRTLDITEDDEEEAAADNLMIGELYLETQQPEQALPYIRKSVDLADRYGNIKSKGTALRKLSEAYGQQGEYNKALISYKQYAETIDSVYAQRERKLEDNLELVAKVSRKLQRIDLIEQDYEITRKTLVLLEKEQLVSASELRTQKWISYGLIILALGLGLATFLIYRSSLQKRKANLLLALRSLRSQMNPHFIFNSLNSVNSYIAANDERQANKYLADFSKLMRQVMENSKHDFVSVNSEIDVLKLYLKLEHSRFSEKFDYSFEIDEKLTNSDFSMPPMLIQPYIENAIWHGLRYKEVKGKLEVVLQLSNNILLATINDDGIGRRKSSELKTRHQKQNTSTGLKNTKSRLEIINEVYAMDYRVMLEDRNQEDGSGTIVKLHIPLQNSKTFD